MYYPRDFYLSQTHMIQRKKNQNPKYIPISADELRTYDNRLNTSDNY